MIGILINDTLTQKHLRVEMCKDFFFQFKRYCLCIKLLKPEKAKTENNF